MIQAAIVVARRSKLNRIDLHILVTRETTSLKTNQATKNTSSKEFAELVVKAQQIQLTRQQCLNSELDLTNLPQFCVLQENDRTWLEGACERLNLSLRAAHRLLKVARTIADLAASFNIERTHLAESLQYRPSIL